MDGFLLVHRDKRDRRDKHPLISRLSVFAVVFGEIMTRLVLLPQIDEKVKPKLLHSCALQCILYSVSFNFEP